MLRKVMARGIPNTGLRVEGGLRMWWFIPKRIRNSWWYRITSIVVVLFLAYCIFVLGLIPNPVVEYTYAKDDRVFASCDHGRVGAPLQESEGPRRTLSPSDCMAAKRGEEDRGGMRGHRLQPRLGAQDSPPLQRAGSGCSGRPSPLQSRRQGEGPAGRGRRGGAARGPAGAAAGLGGRGDVERAEGGALDSAQERLGEGARPAGFRVSEEGGYESPGSQAFQRPGRTFREGGFQKSLPERVREIEELHPEAEVQLWAEDEARLGLKPVVRRVWAPVGERPVARFERGYKWTYLYGFVRPESGKVFWLILPTVNTELFSLALGEFAKEVGAGKDKRILLVVEKAGWHTGGEMEVPEGIHLEFLPSGSPELMPAERLWPLTNEAVANGLFEEIEEIEQTLLHRCVELLDQAELIEGLTNYHWWPQTA